MILGRVGGFVGLGLYEVDLNLKGRVGQTAQDLRLGRDLEGHEVEQADAQGTDVLRDGAALGHDEYILGFEDSSGGQAVSDFNGHREFTPKSNLLTYYSLFGGKLQRKKQAQTKMKKRKRNLKKGVDNRKREWYYIQAASRSGSEKGSKMIKNEKRSSKNFEKSS